ncbi:hypothetical protein [Actinoplanes sp. NPDC026670]|uniref:hypothetical protein n=1 Tax=Actinoplanes sp. NPDC026670 TaxID=3154700 RepID=UPI0033C60B48
MKRARIILIAGLSAATTALASSTAASATTASPTRSEIAQNPTGEWRWMKLGNYPTSELCTQAQKAYEAAGYRAFCGLDTWFQSYNLNVYYYDPFQP